MNLFSSLLFSPQWGDCGGLIIPSLSRDHSPTLARTFRANCTPWIKHQALSSNQPGKSEYVEISFSRTFFILKRNPERIVQSPAMEPGCIWIELFPIRKGTWGHNKVYSFEPGGSINNPRRAAAACSFGQSEDCTIAVVGLRISFK